MQAPPAWGSREAAVSTVLGFLFFAWWPNTNTAGFVEPCAGALREPMANTGAPLHTAASWTSDDCGIRAVADTHPGGPLPTFGVPVGASSLSRAHSAFLDVTAVRSVGYSTAAVAGDWCNPGPAAGGSDVVVVDSKMLTGEGCGTAPGVTEEQLALEDEGHNTISKPLNPFPSRTGASVDSTPSWTPTPWMYS